MSIKYNNDKKFKLTNVEIYNKGELKGYMQGIISFINKPDSEHEFLYRLSDIENGDNFKLISIDYGYENNLVDILWSEIENYCKELYNYRLFRKETEFIIK